MTHIDFDQIVARDRDEFFEKAAHGRSEQEILLIRQAYELAEEAHRPQRRKSGEPYIIHPIAVARIVCVELQLGTNPIIAALLHDVVEDTPYTVEDIRERFGDDVAFLVQVVTKEKKQEYEMSKQLDNFRQMLNSIHYDIRALLIKLADRLHNMRTLASMRADKQMKIAGETDYFYAPLANRLGLYDVKSELENLSLRYRSPEEYAQIERQVNQYIDEEGETISMFCQSVHESLSQNGVRATVSPKFHSPYRNWRRMQQTNTNFKQLEFKHIVNVMFEPQTSSSEKNQCLGVYSLITDICKEKPGSVRNYIDSPKENGYQSLHFKVMCDRGAWVEIHISSERMARNSRMSCVAERATSVEKWIEKFKSVLQDIAYHGKDGGFIEDVVSSFYHDDIIVFTPKGNSVMLPKGATALDFAYEIHTKIGDKAKFARINGKLCSIKTVLTRGDRVEIGTDIGTRPSPDWLDSAITYKARKSIASALRKTNAERAEPEYCLCPVCHPIPGDEVVGFSAKGEQAAIHKRNCPDAISLAAQDGESIVEVDFTASSTLYAARIEIAAVNRNNLLLDLVSIISRELQLSITDICSMMKDEIVRTTVNLSVHSAGELTSIISRLERIESIEEVKRITV